MRTQSFEDLIHGDYSIVLADPPWAYTNATTRGAAERHYSTMSVDELVDLEVKRIAADDAVLFLWVTWPTLHDGLRVMRAWEFAYRTIGLLWVKTNDDGTVFMGVGHYTRSNTEPCLIGVRGRGLERADLGVSSVLLAPRKQHSAKPDEARYRIERLYGEQKRVELFARGTRNGWDESRNGWDAWGNEVA